MKAMYKYPLELVPQTVEMPAGAVPLAVAWQRGVCGNGLMLWALVDLDEQTTVKRRFVIAPTGQPLPDEAAHWPYVGRVELPTGEVAHVFVAG